jgi:hypothetical protein
VVPLQQPFGHEVALQTQAPPLEQVVPVAHDVHEPPLMPQLCAVGGEWHCLLPSQQPPAHDDALQTHMPFEQVCPVAQAVQEAPPVPQVPLLEVRHMPPLSQQPLGQEVALQIQLPPEQAWPVAQALHAAPLMPQVPVAEVRHWPLESQQPFGQDEALQTQAPFEQAWPVAQATQALPPVPQVAVAEVRHMPLESQQPFGQDEALQTQAPCALQAWFAAQATHWPPLAPHCPAEAVTHWPLAQQPLQLMLPQLQAPLLQVWPEAHMPQALPAEPHDVVDCADSAMHRPCESQQPFGHEVGLQTHRPAASHAWPEAHAAQAAPAVPQVAAAWLAYGTQVPFDWQQPFGQDADVQAHLPVASQVCPAAHAAHAPPAVPHD